MKKMIIKKTLSVLLALGMATQSTVFVTAAIPSKPVPPGFEYELFEREGHILGDIEGDGDIDANDADILISFIHTGKPFEPNLNSADLNYDARMSMVDYVYLKYALDYDLVISACWDMNCSTGVDRESGDYISFAFLDEERMIISGVGKMRDFTVKKPLGAEYDEPSLNEYDIKDVKRVWIKDGIETIGDYAFFGYDSLTDIVIGKDVKEIGNYAFGGCASIKNVTYLGSAEDWAKVSIGEGNGKLIDSIEFGSGAPSISSEIKNGSCIASFANIPSGSSIAYACYLNNRLVFADTRTYSGEKTMSFTVSDSCDKIKIMAWESMKNSKPVCSNDETIISK